MQDLLSGILAQTQPKPQTTSASHTITKLCEQLQNATLIEDRRAAVLGLKGFCRGYREQVVAGGLRGLVNALRRDGADADILKASLEALLLLCLKDKSAATTEIDYIALHIADEFTQREENIFILIDILENEDFYVRLYTLELLNAILVNRPQRTRQCVFTAPLGISRVVSTIDDHHEPIQSAAIRLLIRLVDGDYDIQKLVAFENIFDKIFYIIDREGRLEGGIIVQDCLLLIAGLLRYNTSNQNLFRETRGITRLSDMMIVGKSDLNWDAQKAKIMNLVLEICRLFVVPNNTATPINQEFLLHAEVLKRTLTLAFADHTNLQVRSMALVTTGELIRGNPKIQELFANFDVPYIRIISPNDHHMQPGSDNVSVTQALVNWALESSSVYAFDLRVGATKCLECYFADNNEMRRVFLQEAIEDFFNPRRDNRNINFLSGILDHETDARSDPYKVWFASVIMLHILEGGKELRDLARSIAVGDESQGEEVVTAVQLISANLMASLQYGLDIRISIAYAMLLSVWLYDDRVAIDEFLSEGSTVQFLIANVAQSASHNPLVEGICCCLLAVLYGACTMGSPISRPTFHHFLVNRIGRDSFIMKLRLLRSNTLMRDFDPDSILSAQKDETGLPNVFFDQLFVDFFKDNYGRLEKVLDRDPNRDPINIVAIEAQTEATIQEIESMRMSFDSLKNELNDMHDKDESNKKIISERENDIEALNKKLQESENTVRSLREELSEKSAALSDKEIKYKEVENNLRNTAQKLVQEHGRTERRIRDLEDATKQAKNRSDQLEKELYKSKQKTVQLEQTLQSAKDKFQQDRSKLEDRARQAEDN
ncbi:p115 like vesicle tethering protein, partial [Dipodascopsis uninucleata]